MSNEPNGHKPHWHRRLLEHRAGTMALLTTACISVGGLVEILPMYTLSAGPAPIEEVTPYTPLELAGRDLYSREGCVQCHSQMIRPFRSETLRYGEWSRAGEYAYDRPFLLGSRRIGPDLQRIGQKYPDGWHYEHMKDPRATSPGSIMPAYAWMLENEWDVKGTVAGVKAMKRLGVPYTDEDVAGVEAQMKEQAAGIVTRLGEAGIQTEPDREIIALIAYLQRLGVDGRQAIENNKNDGTTDAGGAP